LDKLVATELAIGKLVADMLAVGRFTTELAADKPAAASM